jgi:hypothetical protein
MRMLQKDAIGIDCYTKKKVLCSAEKNHFGQTTQ